MPAPQARPARRTQAERRAETQKRLYGAALECLAERGYAGMTLSEVVKRAGLSQGALWRYCNTKAELAYGAIRFADTEDWRDRTANLASTDASALLSMLLATPSDLYSKAILELFRACASDDEVRRLVADGGWEQWLAWSDMFSSAAGEDVLDEQLASLVRVLSLAATALKVFFRDEDIATVVRGDIERILRDALEGRLPHTSVERKAE